MKSSLVMLLSLATLGLFVPNVRADETLLAEVAFTGLVGHFYPPDAVAYLWSPSNEVFHSFHAGDAWANVPQHWEIMDSQGLQPDDLNQAYRTFDFSLPNPGFNHLWRVEDITGLIQNISIAPEELFSGLDGVDDDGLTITSFYNPPNGNSFVGTNMRFTSMVMTVGPIVPVEPDRFQLSFATQFYGVPEPSGVSLFALCLGLGRVFTVRTLPGRGDRCRRHQ